MSTGASPTGAQVTGGRVPGEAGVWVFVLGDMLVFGLFFATFVFYRNADPALFEASRATLNQHCGALNTLLLLLSSWLVVLGVADAREREGRLTPRLFAGALACGAGFVAVKIFEYGEKLDAGIGITTNDFYMYYYVFTGVHLVHVLVGIGVLSFLYGVARRGIGTERDLHVLESGGIFWHMVDLLWIVLFPLLYLMR